MSDIEHTIAGLQREAEPQSTGVFTLSPERSAERFGEFQKALPGFWLLRLFQAMESAGCLQVDLRIKRQSVQVEAHGGDLLPADSLIQSAGQDRASDRHLRLAILALISLAPRGLSWSRRGRQFVFSQGHSQVKASPYRGDGQLQVDLPLLRDPKMAAELHLVASQRLGWGRAKIVLDGRPQLPDWPAAEHYRWTGTILESYSRAPSGFAFQEPELGPYRPVDGIYRWNIEGAARFKRPRAISVPCMIYKFQGEGPYYSLILAQTMQTRKSGPARFFGVREGVLLEGEEFELGVPQALILADASHLKVDASGLRLIRDQAFEDLIDKARQELRSTTDLLIHNLDRLPAYLRSAHESALARSPHWLLRLFSPLVPWFYSIMEDKGEVYERGLREYRTALELQKMALLTYPSE